MSSVEFSKNIKAAEKIADRAPDEFVFGCGGRMAFMMDLLAADGMNGNQPIDLDELAKSDDFNFFHDIAGIARHIDRATGKLMDCFVPRYVR